MLSDSDEDHLDDEHEDEVADKLQCPVALCGYKVTVRGAQAKTRLQNHVQKNHPQCAEEARTKIEERFQRSHTPGGDFKCDSCQKELRGNAFHRKRHAASCSGGPVKKTVKEEPS